MFLIQGLCPDKLRLRTRELSFAARLYGQNVNGHFLSSHSAPSQKYGRDLDHEHDHIADGTQSRSTWRKNIFLLLRDACLVDGSAMEELARVVERGVCACAREGQVQVVSTARAM